jgi:hypothetical protein
MVEVYGLNVPSDLINRIPPNFRGATGTCELLSQAAGVQSDFDCRRQLAPLTKSYGSGGGVVGSWKSIWGTMSLRWLVAVLVGSLLRERISTL